MTRPSRDTTAGRVYLDLRARARRDRRGTDELLVLYVLERFLYRLSMSRHRDRLVLKGGMLLAAYNQRRPTRDVDLLARAITSDVDAVAALVRELVTIDVDDGVVYEPERLSARTIRNKSNTTQCESSCRHESREPSSHCEWTSTSATPSFPPLSRSPTPRYWASLSPSSATRSRPSSPRSWSP
jgi:Nucleotidyl transferase AbiEii toxin, Type IV TA system